MEYIKRILYVLQLMVMIPIHLAVFILLYLPLSGVIIVLEIVLLLPIYYVITGEFYFDDYVSVTTAAWDVMFEDSKFTLKRYSN